MKGNYLTFPSPLKWLESVFQYFNHKDEIKSFYA